VLSPGNQNALAHCGEAKIAAAKWRQMVSERHVCYDKDQEY
jgi:hypothetical protein